MNEPKYRLVEVEWFDAQSGFGQAEPIEEFVNTVELLHTFSTGYLLHEDKEKVIIGLMIFGGDMLKHSQIIPRGMIKKITQLNRGKKYNGNV